MAKLERDVCHGKSGKAKTRLGFRKRGATVGGCAFRDFGAIASTLAGQCIRTAAINEMKWMLLASGMRIITCGRSALELFLTLSLIFFLLTPSIGKR